MSLSPEILAQRAVVAWLRHVLPAGSKVAHIPNEAKGSAATAAQRARYGQARRKSGVLDGCPDLVLALPNGETAWIEMKADAAMTGRKAEVRSTQHDLHDEMRAIGHRVGVATSIETARFLLNQWGIPLREAADQLAFPAVVRLGKPRHAMPNDALPF